MAVINLVTGWEEYMLFADSNLRLRFDAEAGPHVVGVSFVRRFTEPEGVLQPPQSVFAAAVNEMRDGDAAIEVAQITGPFEPSGPGSTQVEKQFLFAGPLIVMPVLRKLAPSIFCQTSHIKLTEDHCNN